MGQRSAVNRVVDTSVCILYPKNGSVSFAPLLDLALVVLRPHVASGSLTGYRFGLA